MVWPDGHRALSEGELRLLRKPPANAAFAAAARLRRLIQKGAIVESAMPETNSMTPDELSRYLRDLSVARSENRTAY